MSPGSGAQYGSPILERPTLGLLLRKVDLKMALAQGPWPLRKGHFGPKITVSAVMKKVMTRESWNGFFKTRESAPDRTMDSA